MIGASRWRQALDRAMGVTDEEAPSLQILAKKSNKFSFLIIVPLVVATGFLLLSVMNDTQIQRRRSAIIDGPQATSSQELWDFVSTTTPANAVLVFRKPFAMSLYGGRKSHVVIPIDSLESLDSVERAYRQYGATHFVVDTAQIDGQVENAIQNWLHRFVENDQHVRSVWRNERFIVYAWK